MAKGFPREFFWGTATAAYQIEGADSEDGKAPSIWTSFSHQPGRIFNGHTGDVACDHYHRFEEDIALMVELGVNAYRFSISWPRVLPEGRGSVNQTGMDFYRRLVDRLLENRITPFITLYHWDLPLALQERIGGWESEDIDQYFGDYAAAMFRALGDRVKYWITLNEPFCYSFNAYGWGEFAPGEQNQKKAFLVAHHLLRAHGEATARFRELIPDGKVGLVNVASWIEPASENGEDIQTAFIVNQLNNDWFFLPVLTGKYPEEADQFVRGLGLLPVFDPQEMNRIAKKPDFWGINYYTRHRMKMDMSHPMFFTFLPPELETTECGWEIYPQGLTAFLKMAQEKYGNIPMFITENGMADKDVLMNGVVADEKRIAYIKSHIEAVQRAMAGGADVRGYFVWSLMDNFEWAQGYSKRFGLVYIDYEKNLERIKKDSYYYYKNFLAL
ncbi:MAG: GH1 family beta-glucosidase [Thermotogota bacterium]|nr:GH1 family beta-glucosidase [Thermotogota bacterium]